MCLLLVDTCLLKVDNRSMDMSEPATVVASSGTAAVLRVLAGAEQGFTIRELGRLAGVSHGRAAQVVRNLSRHGVVLTQVQGRSQLCSLNRDNVATPLLIDLTRLRTTAFDRLRQLIDAWLVPAVHASIFGSTARGDGDVNSDIDVLVIRPDHLQPDDEQWVAQLQETADSAYRLTGNALAWFEISRHDLHGAVTAGEAIVHEWRREAVHLAGERLRDLIRGAS